MENPPIDDNFATQEHLLLLPSFSVCHYFYGRLRRHQD